MPRENVVITLVSSATLSRLELEKRALYNCNRSTTNIILDQFYRVSNTTTLRVFYGGEMRCAATEMQIVFRSCGDLREITEADLE